jgi:hypothetical protein
VSVQRIRQSDIATWPDEYESIWEFYFWEPQHLNRFSPPPDRRKTLNTVLEHLRAIGSLTLPIGRPCPGSGSLVTVG